MLPDHRRTVEELWGQNDRVVSRSTISDTMTVPLAKGRPSRDYPFPWLVYPWQEGESLDLAIVEDWDVLAQEIGEFIIALGRRPTDGDLAPTRRGNPMATYDAGVRRALRQLDDSVDMERAQAVWQNALDVGEWSGDPVWVYGDVLPGKPPCRKVTRPSGDSEW